MRGTRFCGIMYKSALNNILFTCYWTFQVSLKSIKQAMANQSMDVVAKVLEQVEEQVDAQLSKLNEIEEEDLDRLRERRLDALKKAQKQKQVCVHLVLGIFLLFPHSFYFLFILRNGCLKAMENTEKSQVRKTFSVKSKKAKMWSAISTEIQHSGRFKAHIFKG